MIKRSEGERFFPEHDVSIASTIEVQDRGCTTPNAYTPTHKVTKTSGEHTHERRPQIVTYRAQPPWMRASLVTTRVPPRPRVSDSLHTLTRGRVKRTAWSVRTKQGCHPGTRLQSSKIKIVLLLFNDRTVVHKRRKGFSRTITSHSLCLVVLTLQPPTPVAIKSVQTKMILHTCVWGTCTCV